MNVMNLNSNQEVDGLSLSKCMTKLPVFENRKLVIYPASELEVLLDIRWWPSFQS